MSIHRSVNGFRPVNAAKFASRIYESLNTPVSLSCYMLLKYQEHRQLAEKSVNPLSYENPQSFWRDYQSIKLLSKYPGLKTGIDTKEVAYQKFLRAESLCKETNERLRNVGTYPQGRLARILHTAQDKIRDILGPLPSLSSLDFGFGPGASFSVRGDTSVYKKVTSTLCSTYAFSSQLQEFLEEFPGWIPEGVHDVILIPGSELTFVPKDAKTDRPICIEPTLNGLYQKGFGSYIRSRLNSHGIDLKDQSINQKLAQKAYSEGLATIDFASASDTISYLTVMNLLPFDWFEALDVARSPAYIYKGEWKSFQKFSSMGNAYTFELESLIFYALAYACVVESGIRPLTGINLSVYGDDVIIPQSSFDFFKEVSEWAGFEISLEKTFKEGRFYESCGLDYFDGILVRPFQLKKVPRNLLDHFYVTNMALRISARCPIQTVRVDSHQSVQSEIQASLRSVRAWLVSLVPQHLRMYGPEGFGDGYFLSTFDEALPPRHRMWCGYIIDSLYEKPVRVKLAEWPISYALYQTKSSGQPKRLAHLEDNDPLNHSEGYALRGKSSIRKKKLFIPTGRWVDTKVLQV